MTKNHDEHGFNANKIFWTLFVLTAIEVGWSMIFKHVPMLHGVPISIMWAGLLGFAFWKGALIYMYFMHMKFEGSLVKWLMRPTPILIAIIVFALMPDVGSNARLVYPVGSQLDKSGSKPGRVVPMENKAQHGTSAPAAAEH